MSFLDFFTDVVLYITVPGTLILVESVTQTIVCRAVTQTIVCRAVSSCFGPLHPHSRQMGTRVRSSLANDIAVASLCTDDVQAARPSRAMVFLFSF